MSFGAGAVLFAISIVAFSGARTSPQRALAAIPLLFSIQQITEGVVWLSLTTTHWAYLRLPATYIFLVFAQMVWPVYIPFCALLLEQHSGRKKIIGATLVTGTALAAYTAVLLALHPPAATAEMHHIRYTLDFALANKWYYGLLYFIPTILSLWLCSQRPLHLLGYLFLASYLFTRLLFHFYVISVWCFFGAIISIVTIAIIYRLNKKETQPQAGR